MARYVPRHGSKGKGGAEHDKRAEPVDKRYPDKWAGRNDSETEGEAPEAPWSRHVSSDGKLRAPESPTVPPMPQQAAAPRAPTRDGPSGAGAPEASAADEEYAEPIPVHLVDQPREKKRHSTRRRVITALLACASILAVLAAGFFVVRGLPAKHQPAQVEVMIPRGLNAKEIGDILAAKRVVNSSFAFKVYAELHGASNSFQPGRYRMRENMEYKHVVAMLVKGPEKEKLTEVTFPEGFTIRKMGERLSVTTGMSASEFEVLAGTKGKSFNYSFLRSNPTGSLEGYLFPKTYGFPKSADEQRVINKMLAQFGRETAGLDWSAAKKRDLSVHEIVTIASLIEREARVASERRLISAVIWNRLRKGIALRIDATVQYGLPEWKERLTYDDLEVDTPYNTYLHKGLPPGPIANPGLASIDAALNPAKVGYLYYVLTDPSGKHTFTNTYSEFLRAKARSRAR